MVEVKKTRGKYTERDAIDVINMPLNRRIYLVTEILFEL